MECQEEQRDGMKRPCETQTDYTDVSPPKLPATPTRSRTTAHPHSQAVEEPLEKGGASTGKPLKKVAEDGVSVSHASGGQNESLARDRDTRTPRGQIRDSETPRSKIKASTTTSNKKSASKTNLEKQETASKGKQESRRSNTVSGEKSGIKKTAACRRPLYLTPTKSSEAKNCSSLSAKSPANKILCIRSNTDKGSRIKSSQKAGPGLKKPQSKELSKIPQSISKPGKDIGTENLNTVEKVVEEEVEKSEGEYEVPVDVNDSETKTREILTNEGVKEDERETEMEGVGEEGKETEMEGVGEEGLERDIEVEVERVRREKMEEESVVNEKERSVDGEKERSVEEEEDGGVEGLERGIEDEVEKVKRRRSTIGRGRCQSTGGRQSMSANLHIFSLEDQVAQIDTQQPWTSLLGHILEISVREACRRLESRFPDDECVSDLRVDLLRQSDILAATVAYDISGRPLALHTNTQIQQQQKLQQKQESISTITAYKKKIVDLEKEYRQWKAMMKERKQACRAAEGEYREAKLGHCSINEDQFSSLTTIQKQFLITKPNYQQYLTEIQTTREKVVLCMGELKRGANAATSMITAANHTASATYNIIEKVCGVGKNTVPTKSLLASYINRNITLQT